jgi:tau tubulin kinase
VLKALKDFVAQSLSLFLGIGYLHRDVKPANYTIGRAELKEVRKVYVFDFGMARKFVHEDGTIKKPRAVARFRGTVKYASVACHARREMCRLDDLESWLYQQVSWGILYL